ncbi:signal peptidase I [Candidatus Roizmanbacteria bacterium CG_4_10_14_0_2_um_filter_36_35]|uniref:Signal peptidase I n=2 Tax=Candidatus Roizmaniibacteriota TaxID=1752723 RepID=A0A2M7U7T9_9BACT|nr:MAG: signal peptidase I [Candidatus Roizmanbacteria bacterium CG_4_10_14_0_2_um_filter_36_35]PJC79926.1 MAG: signal peptidase I [Candidatus Roizmanbacteria bacterium CG_4_8_14_3_um_filter_36_12]
MLNITKTIIGFVMDILETVVFVGSMFIVVYLFILTPNQVKGASMEPTFDSGDYILTSRVTYKFRRLERGDVVVFKSPKNPDIEYIKRIIGLPGDVVTIKNSQVFVNNNLVSENYIFAATNLWDGGCIKDGVPYTIPLDEIFVMGDNRPRSSDSREFCSVPVQSLIGQVFYRYFPANKIGTVINPLPSSIR